MKSLENPHYPDQFHTNPDTVNADDQVNILNHSNTFAIFDRWGNIYPKGKMVHGIYHRGTRFLNTLILRINGQKPLLLGSTVKEDNNILSVDLTNPFLQEGEIPDNSLHLSRNQFIRESAYFEEITCSNYCEKTCPLELQLKFDGDFKDIFEIRGTRRTMNPQPVVYSTQDAICRMVYEGMDSIRRETVITFASCADCYLKNGKASFAVDLLPGEEISIHYAIHFVIEGDAPDMPDYLTAKASIQKELLTNRRLFADIYTSSRHFNHWITRSAVDLFSLMAETKEGRYLYAGVPWYNTPFGRDGLITAMETLWIAPGLSKSILLFLAARQAGEINGRQDAEPGKILHEMRDGEMANTGEIPFKEYFGTIDATPLFIMLAGMYYERTADISLIKTLWPNIKAALFWIDHYGDRDGDGFVEYSIKSKDGLVNQGWKDSFDSIMHADATLATAPIALCEVQAYVYSAKNFAATLAEALGEHPFSRQLAQEAALLKSRFNDQFWDPGLNTYVLALDGQKRPCRVITSNAGHCLFTRIAEPDKATLLAETLTGQHMFSGWGIRTLSSREKKFNPMSYHNGSVWPHDNALIAYGLSLYGFHDQVLKITQAFFDASLYIPFQRLPELYCGFPRKAYEGPTPYPVACSPQAWSVASVFLLLQACLQIHIQAVSKTIILNNPRLPDYLQKIDIRNLQLDGFSCDLHGTRMAEGKVHMHLAQKGKGWKTIITHKR